MRGIRPICSLVCLAILLSSVVDATDLPTYLDMRRAGIRPPPSVNAHHSERAASASVLPVLVCTTACITLRVRTSNRLEHDTMVVPFCLSATPLSVD
jgi:hypothetical protein